MSSGYSNKFALLNEEEDHIESSQVPSTEPKNKSKTKSKREFDRKSGSGRNDTEKRGGSGAYNWGVDGADDLVAAATQDEESFPVDEEEVYVEPETVSLEEFQNQQAMMKPEDDVRELREAREDYENAQEFVVRRSVEDEELVSLQKTKKSNKKKGNKKGKNNLADEFLFGNADKSNGKPGNKSGNRGGNRSTRGGFKNSRGGKKDSRSRVNLSDKSSFPSLVSA